MKHAGLIFILLSSIIFISFYSGKISLLSYTESSSGLQSITLESGRTEIEFGDINSDGNLDVLSIGDHGCPLVNSQQHGVMIYFGNGTGANWSIYQNGNFGYGGIAIGDVNNDGKPDIGYGMHHNYSGVDFGDQILEVALGDGTGLNWTPWDDSLATQGETWGMFTTDFGDVDNDGLLDVGSVSFGCCAGIHIYKNMGVGKWRQTFGFLNGNSNMEFVFGDMNNDGNLDFAAGHQYGAAYFGSGDGTFALKHNNLPSGGTSGYIGVSLGDVNNDGAKDIAFCTSSGAVNVWAWNINTQNWVNLSANLPASGNYEATQLADMNRDGFLDLVTFGGGTGTVWLGNGGTSWTQNATVTTPAPGYYVDLSIEDADHNGYPDILIEARQQYGTMNYINKIWFYKESTPYTSLNIAQQFPKGFERFKNNSVQFIKWLSAAPLSPASKVKLELSSTGSNGPWTLIKDSLPNNGTCQWAVPQNINSENCYIKSTVFIPGTSSSYTSITPNRFVIGNLVGVSKNNENNPESFALYQNYPNPFNPETVISFQLSASCYVKLIVYDVNGKEVAVLEDGLFKPGIYNSKFLIHNSLLSSGIYFYQLIVTDEQSATIFKDTKRMVLIK